MVWEHGEDSLVEFFTYLNSIHTSIKFTYKYSHERIEFLDVMVIREGNSLITDLFVKETALTSSYIFVRVIHIILRKGYLLVRHLGCVVFFLAKICVKISMTEATKKNL